MIFPYCVPILRQVWKQEQTFPGGDLRANIGMTVTRYTDGNDRMAVHQPLNCNIMVHVSWAHQTLRLLIMKCRRQQGKDPFWCSCLHLARHDLQVPKLLERQLLGMCILSSLHRKLCTYTCYVGECRLLNVIKHSAAPCTLGSTNLVTVPPFHLSPPLCQCV